MKYLYLVLIAAFIFIGCKGCDTGAQFQPMNLRLFWDYPDDSCDVFIVYSWQGNDTTQMSALTQIATVSYVSGQTTYIYPFVLNAQYVMMGARARMAGYDDSDMAITRFYSYNEFKKTIPINLRIIK